MRAQTDRFVIACIYRHARRLLRAISPMRFDFANSGRGSSGSIGKKEEVGEDADADKVEASGIRKKWEKIWTQMKWKRQEEGRSGSRRGRG